MNDVAREHGPGAQIYAATQIIRAQEAWLELLCYPTRHARLCPQEKRNLRKET